MKKSLGMAYILWFLSIFGWLGFHRMYVGRMGSAILWIVTLGIGGIGAFADLFLIPEMVSSSNKELRQEKELATLRTAATLAASQQINAAKAQKKAKKEKSVAVDRSNVATSKAKA